MLDFLKRWFRRRGPDEELFEPTDDEPQAKEPSRWRGGLDRLKSKLGKSRFEVPERFKRLDFDLNAEAKKLTAHAGVIRWAIIVLAIFLLSEVTSRVIGLFIRPTTAPPPRRVAPVARQAPAPTDDYSMILRRNMFNVEGKIPEPFDQGMLDCFSQARPSSQPLTLLGTIVMRDDRYSVALVQEGGNAQSVAVKKDDSFFNKYTALKVERQRLCFQVRATQDLEYIEVKDDTPSMGGFGSPSLSTGTGGITVAGEDNFSVRRSFLDEKLANLNEILQSARAVPYIDASGNFKGFLIQSINQDSIFFDLGVRQGDVLTAVNEIQLDNAGKGLEAFQRLRNASKITLEVTRGGQQKTLTYTVQ